LAFLPTLAGSKWIIEPVIQRLAQDRFVLTTEAVHLSWFSPLEIRGIVIKQDGDVPLLTIDTIRSNRGLLGYLIGGRNLGKVEIVKPTIDIELLADESNLSRFINAVRGSEEGTSEAKPTAKPLFDIDIAIQQCSAKVQQAATDAPLVVIPPFDVDLSYQTSQGTTMLHIAPAAILREVELRPELMELGLGYAVPVLAKSAWFDGKISLEVDAWQINLDQPIDSFGKARLTMHQVRSGPSDPQIIQLLAVLAKLRGREPLQEIVFVDGSQIEVGLAQQKVLHSGLQFGLPKVDPRLQISSRGTVGLVDRSLDLQVRIPIPVENIARREAVQALGVPTIEMPIKGTLDDPKPDWLALRGSTGLLLQTIQSQLAEDAPGTAAAIGVLEGLASGEADEVIVAATDLAKELLERRRAAKEAEANGETPPSSGTPIRDALRGWLQNRNQPVGE
jgi:hypothetical protein